MPCRQLWKRVETEVSCESCPKCCPKVSLLHFLLASWPHQSNANVLESPPSGSNPRYEVLLTNRCLPCSTGSPGHFGAQPCWEKGRSAAQVWGPVEGHTRATQAASGSPSAPRGPLLWEALAGKSLKYCLCHHIIHKVVDQYHARVDILWMAWNTSVYYKGNRKCQAACSSATSKLVIVRGVSRN